MMEPTEMQKGSTPRQKQEKQPGIESKMTPLPHQPTDYKGSDKLKGKNALITVAIVELVELLLFYMQKKGQT